MKTKWTAVDLPPLDGKLAVITGGNSGIGFQAAREWIRHGGRVIIACRSEPKGKEAVRRITSEFKSAPVELVLLDLADLSSIRDFAHHLESRNEPIDVLLNNAGIMAVPTRRLTADGFELQFGTNHLGHFALTGLLLPLLMKAPAARIVTVSSIAHKGGKLDFDNLNSEKKYKDLTAYKNSKLANLLFTFELQRRLAAIHSSVISVAAHPGVARTNLFAAGSRLDKQPLFSWLTELFVPLLGQSDSAGAWPLLYAASADDVHGSDYFGPKNFFEFRGHPTRATATARAQDPATARRLWEISEQLTAVTYSALDPAIAVGTP